MGSNQTIRGRDIETIISKPVFIMQTTAHNDISSSNPIRIENRSIPDDTLTRSIQINDYRRQRGCYTSRITCHSYLSSSHEPVSKREKKEKKEEKNQAFPIYPRICKHWGSQNRRRRANLVENYQGSLYAGQIMKTRLTMKPPLVAMSNHCFQPSSY